MKLFRMFQRHDEENMVDTEVIIDLDTAITYMFSYEKDPNSPDENKKIARIVINNIVIANNDDRHKLYMAYEVLINKLENGWDKKVLTVDDLGLVK